MSVEFSNAYQDILFDNLSSVIKQNIIFQTQLKLNEKVADEKQQLQQQVDQLVLQIQEHTERTKMFEQYKILAEQSSVDSQEKARIQLALNESMQKNTDLQYKIDVLLGEAQTLNQNLDVLKDELSRSLQEKTLLETKNSGYVSEIEKLKNKLNNQTSTITDKIVEKVTETTTVKKPKLKSVIETKESDSVILKKINDGSSF